MIVAITVTISKFGPSGSFTKENIILDANNDDIPRMSNEVLLDFKYICD